MRRGFEARPAAAFMAVLTVLLGFAGSAFAHASLIRSSPDDGGMVAKAPSRFELSFNEPVSPLVLRLVTPAGGAVALTADLQGNTLSIQAPPDLADGSYALSWRVVSADGHPIGGAVVFSIGAPSAGGVPDIAGDVDWPLRIAIWTARLLVYTGLFIGVGGAFFMSWIGAGDSRSPARLGGAVMALGLVGAAVSLGLQGADALGAGLGSLGQVVTWKTGFATSYGSTAAIAVCALLGGLAAFRLQGMAAKALSLLALAGVGAALAYSGHASAAPPQWLTRQAVFLHAVGIAFWAGALMPLGFALARPGAQATGALLRFSQMAPLAVLSLIVAGVALAVVQLQSVEAMWTTAYGAVFLAKLALLLPLFGLAAANRWRLTRPAAAGQTTAVLMLRRSIVAEVCLLLAIFGVAAIWRFTPPPRSLLQAAAQPASIHIHAEKAMADLTITPGRAGPAAATMVVMTPDFGLLPAKEVTLTLANPAAGIEPITRPATQAGDGPWQVDGLLIPAPGRWSVRIEILVSDFELARLQGEIDIRP